MSEIKTYYIGSTKVSKDIFDEYMERSEVITITKKNGTVDYYRRHDNRTERWLQSLGI
jgi:hypothetical protein